MALPASAQAPDRTRRHRARLIAVLALIGALVALVVAVTTVDSTDELTGEEAQAAMVELAAANGALSDRLDALTAGDSPRDAQAATRSTTALVRRLDGEVEGDGSLPDRVHAVYRTELAYLDAVGSTLNNPASPLRGRSGERAQALRDVLQQVPGGDHRAIRGGMALVLYSEARAGE
jgi:hypothetical protein